MEKVRDSLLEPGENCMDTCNACLRCTCPLSVSKASSSESVRLVDRNQRDDGPVHLLFESPTEG